MMPASFRDILTGTVLLLLGVFIAGYALANYTIGEMSRIGSAVFPVAVGALLALLGLLISISGWFKVGPKDPMPLRPTVMILASIAVFASLVDRAGLLPAVLVLVAGAILADNQHSWRSALTLTASVTVAVWVVFGWLLGMSFAMVRWPL